MLKNVHPGEVLLEEFLKQHGISQKRLGEEIGMPSGAISDLVRGRRAVTAHLALRLAKFFGTSQEFWLNLQSRYDLEDRGVKENLGLPHSR